MRYRILSAFVISTLLLAAVSRAQVIYEEDIQPLFNDNCIACHGGTSGVFLGSYDDVMNSVGDQYDENIVIAEEPDESPLVDKIEPDPQIGDRMPRGGPYLEDEEIALIRQWIDEGAHESPPTHIADEEASPARFELSGNYPNPFNPETTVRFQLPEQASWSLTLYTTDGRHVWEDSGWSQGGEVTVRVNLESQSSGIYIYVVEMRADPTTHARQSGRMILLK